MWQLLVTNKTGKLGEKVALQFLKKQGLSLECNNYAFFGGEIDLIMKDKETLVFCEVRFRKNDKFGSALESITPLKVKKIIKTAALYQCKKNIYGKVSCRFDIVCISPQDCKKNGLCYDYKRYNIDWIKNAITI